MYFLFFTVVVSIIVAVACLFVQMTAIRMKKTQNWLRKIISLFCHYLIKPSLSVNDVLFEWPLKSIILKLIISQGFPFSLSFYNILTLIPLIFAHLVCAKIKWARKRPIFAHFDARKLMGARNSEIFFYEQENLF